MSERIKVVGPRATTFWLLVTVNVVVLTALAMCGLLAYPPLREWQEKQTRLAEAEQHYQAGIAFQSEGSWADAEEAFRQIIVLDANYKDAQARWAEVRGELATAAAETIESHYNAGVAFQEMGDWEAAEREYRLLVEQLDPDYRDVLKRMAEVKAKQATATARVRATAVAAATATAKLRKPTLTLTSTPPPTLTPTPAVEPLEALEVPSDGTQKSSTHILERGLVYSIVVTGTYRYDKGEQGEFADAGYLEDDRDEYSIPNTQFRINDVTHRPALGDLGNHRYVYYWVGADAKLTFQIVDEKYSDNEGALQVTIYRGHKDQ